MLDSVFLQSLLLNGSLPEDEQDVFLALDSGDAEQQLVMSLWVFPSFPTNFVFATDQILSAAQVWAARVSVSFYFPSVAALSHTPLLSRSSFAAAWIRAWRRSES